jgi:hypothetical protein
MPVSLRLIPCIYFSWLAQILKGFKNYGRVSVAEEARHGETLTIIGVPSLLSEADHRLNHAEPWAAQRLHTLRSSTGQPVHPLA